MIIRIIISLFLMLNMAIAADVPAINATESNYLSGKDPNLNKKEWKAAVLAHKWITKKEEPIMKENGQIAFLYGYSLPTVICAPLRTCDLELQAGEVVTDLHVGDAVRWKITPALSGAGQFKTTHLIIKPQDIGIETSMVVLTDRRTYHLKLLSRKSNWMPIVGFEYPADTDLDWLRYQQSIKQEEQQKEKRVIAETGHNLDDLDFNYAVEGSDPEWKPIRVYNNGVKTIIQMPKSMSQTEAPALFILNMDDEKQLVNYRLIDGRYIVDMIFNRAVLVAGVGDSQEIVEINRLRDMGTSR